MRSPHLPHRRFDGTFGWRRQLLLKVSSVICEGEYVKTSLSLGIACKCYWSIQFCRAAISRSNTNRVRINLSDICLLSSLREFDVILLVMVIRANTNANHIISTGKFNSAAQTGMRISAISHHAAESFQGVKCTPSVGIDA